jgi:hypothetical protein
MFRYALPFLPSPRRYSSGVSLASWLISLYFSLFFICSDDEASNGRMQKWEEYGWKRSWPSYFHWFSIYSIHSRMVIWFLNNLVFTVWGCYPQTQPSTWRSRVSLFVWFLPLHLSGMDASTCSYATAGIALRVSGALKPHHHHKVETPSVGALPFTERNFSIHWTGGWMHPRPVSDALAARRSAFLPCIRAFVKQSAHSQRVMWLLCLCERVPMGFISWTTRNMLMMFGNRNQH